jgi:F420-0:gamma-glutamyl ligase-like protein
VVTPPVPPLPQWRRSIEAVSCSRTWRITLAGVLIGFLAGQAMAITWLALAPAKTVQERRLIETASRASAAAARCVEQASQEAGSGC